MQPTATRTREQVSTRRKTGARLAQTGVGHHLANYLDAKDIPASDPSKE